MTCNSLKQQLTVAALVAATALAAQQPFSLNTDFHFPVQSIAVGDVLERPDGKIIVSGNMLYPDAQSQRAGLLLENNGAIIPRPADRSPIDWYYYMGGKMVPWEERIYVKNGQGISRYWMDGRWDTTFQNPPDPRLFMGQGGDFHAFPDGRLLIAGNYWLRDTVRGFVGWQYGLVWLNPDGGLDTTRIHRSIGPNGALQLIKQLPDGKFLCGGGSGIFEGDTVSTIFRVQADGSLDSGFNAPSTNWCEFDCFLPRPDGKVIVAGRWQFANGQSHSLVRLLPNGAVDPSFNNSLDFESTYTASPYEPRVMHVQPMGNGMLAITGVFDRINGAVHGGIAMIDTAGNLLPGYFEGSGCGGYLQGAISAQTWYQGILGIEPAQDGSYFIYGAYHGYDDGTTNDPNQRLLSKLYGLNVGIHEQDGMAVQPLTIAPNPTAGQTVLSLGTPVREGRLTIHDASGRLVWQAAWPAGAVRYVLPAGALAPGAYVLRVSHTGSAARGPIGIGPTATPTPAYTGRMVVLP